MTHYENIKSMSIEEMARGISAISFDCTCCPANNCHPTKDMGIKCVDVLIQWLESEVEEND